MNVYGMIAHLVKDDMTSVKKMKKSDLLSLAQELLNNRYCEMPNTCVKEEYQERFNTIVKGV
jgi:hypothetical protein